MGLQPGAFVINYIYIKRMMREAKTWVCLAEWEHW